MQCQRVVNTVLGMGQAGYWLTVDILLDKTMRLLRVSDRMDFRDVGYIVEESTTLLGKGRLRFPYIGSHYRLDTNYFPFVLIYEQG